MAPWPRRQGDAPCAVHCCSERGRESVPVAYTEYTQFLVVVLVCIGMEREAVGRSSVRRLDAGKPGSQPQLGPPRCAPNYFSTVSLVYIPATEDISKIQVCTRGVSLSPSHTLPDPAGEKLCRLQSPRSGGVPLWCTGESSHLSKS